MYVFKRIRFSPHVTEFIALLKQFTCTSSIGKEIYHCKGLFGNQLFKVFTNTFLYSAFFLNKEYFTLLMKIVGPLVLLEKHLQFFFSSNLINYFIVDFISNTMRSSKERRKKLTMSLVYGRNCLCSLHYLFAYFY